MGGNTAKAQEIASGVEQSWTGDMLFTPDLAVQLINKIEQQNFYIFNVGPMEHRVEKGSAGRYLIKACEKGKPFSEPIVFPAIVTETYMQENMIKTHSVTGKFMCIDIVHPFIAHSINGKEAGWSIGQNLDDFGVFWTTNKIPTAVELEEAVKKLERTFRAALAEATTLEATGRLQEVTPLMRHAADYFGQSREWNKLYVRNLECPVCGGAMKEGIAVHSCGAVLNWPKAIFHGARNFDDARKQGMNTEVLEKQVAALRGGGVMQPGAHAPEPADDLGGSFLTASALEQIERETEQVGKSAVLSQDSEIRQSDPKQPAEEPRRQVRKVGPPKPKQRSSRGDEATRGKS